MLILSDRSKHLFQSGIRATTQRCLALNGVNLGQGVCDIPIDPRIKQAAIDAIQNNKSIYSACEGVKQLREKIAKKIGDFNHVTVDPSTEVVITHGATGAYVCAAMALFNPGDEVILFEPFYGYHRNIFKLQDIHIKTVAIKLDDFSIDMDELSAAIGPKTRGIVLCTPNNPAGKVFSAAELLMIGQLAEKHNLAIISDEIYEYFTYPGFEHVSIAALENFKARTITISGFSKTYNMTGWRLGYASGPAAIIEKMALIQDLYYVCPSTPMQYAVMTALDLPASYYQLQRDEFLQKRNLVLKVVRDEIGLTTTEPQGSYYVLVNTSSLGFADDLIASDEILSQTKVAMVPGRAFYDKPEDGKHELRLCYALNQQAIEQAMEQLKVLRK